MGRRRGLVGKRCGIHRDLSTIRLREEAGFRGEGALAADGVGGSVPSCGHQPGTRVVRHAVERPATGGDGERLLRGFLGEIKVAEETDQGGQDAAPLLAEDMLERRYQYTSEGRISTAPP